jgi:uracil-DNA glycosylase family 4
MKSRSQRAVDWQRFYFTNAVKCSATKAQDHQCFAACRTFLERQVRALNPRFIVMIGTAAS